MTCCNRCSELSFLQFFSDISHQDIEVTLSYTASLREVGTSSSLPSQGGEGFLEKLSGMYPFPHGVIGD